MATRQLTVLSAALLLAGCAHLERSACAAPGGSNAQIEGTIHAFFDALRRDDQTAFQHLTTSRFFAFDAGKRYSGIQLVNLVKDAHARRVELNWSVGPVDTRFACEVAWSTWENVGSAGTPPDVKPLRWLESAVLVREDGAWKIDFFHSQRAAAK